MNGAIPSHRSNHLFKNAAPRRNPAPCARIAAKQSSNQVIVVGRLLNLPLPIRHLVHRVSCILHVVGRAKQVHIGRPAFAALLLRCRQCIAYPIGNE